jgi:hypothetical protein
MNFLLRQNNSVYEQVFARRALEYWIWWRPHANMIRCNLFEDAQGIGDKNISGMTLASGVNSNIFIFDPFQNQLNTSKITIVIIER